MNTPEEDICPPHVRLRNTISAEIRGLTEDPEKKVLGVAIKGNTLVVFFSPLDYFLRPDKTGKDKDVVPIQSREWSILPGDIMGDNQARKARATLYNQVHSDCRLIHLQDGKAAICEELLASNPYGITANDITLHGSSVVELCARKAHSTSLVAAAFLETVTLMGLTSSAELVTNAITERYARRGPDGRDMARIPASAPSSETRRFNGPVPRRPPLSASTADDNARRRRGDVVIGEHADAGAAIGLVGRRGTYMIKQL